MPDSCPHPQVGRVPVTAGEEAVPLQRRRWTVNGQVQGVGYRPFVHRLARETGVTGWVRNEGASVVIEAQGEAAAIERFGEAIRRRHPRLASVREVGCQVIQVMAGERGFKIGDSWQPNAGGADVTVDTATCPECVAELLSETDRRAGYGLINCTNCGPRFSIIRRVPYDRCNTTMAGFAMCPACQREYQDIGDRRYHAQPVACHDCGPKVALADPAGKAMAGDPIETAARMLLAGKVLAIKGLGGYHLACRADDEQTVGRLRALKKRDAKPFAVMVAGVEQARQLVQLSAQAAEEMASPASPIVLAPRQAGARVAASVAPGCGRLGVMVANTPIQHLLFAAMQAAGLVPLVMTSGNVSDEPLVIKDQEAVRRLGGEGGMCDAILWHDREIERGVDDSVVLDLDDAVLPMRRARGYAPGGVTLPVNDGSMGLCAGGELKNVVAVVREGQAILSQHLGDLTHVEAFKNCRKAIADMQELFGVRPAWVAVDLHPMYLCSQEGRRIAAELGVQVIGVQHHHAHAAAVMAEHGVTEKVLAVVCDGTGYGADGTIWGGELLLADLNGYERLGHIRPLLLAGGDAAAKDTRRCGLALLHQAFGGRLGDHPAARQLMPEDGPRDLLCRMIRDGVNCVPSSGAGRVFDGVAALLGVCGQNRYEAEAAMRLEAVAGETEWKGDGEPAWAEVVAEAKGWEIDFGPLVRELVKRRERHAVAELAALFHEEFCRAWYQMVQAAGARTGVRTVVMSGGVMCNAIVTRRLTQLLRAQGFRVLRHERVPANDGGIALGQAAVAAARRTLCA